MNILFLVSTFLCIFVLFNTTVFKDTVSFSCEHKAICSYLTAKQKLQNKWESYKYKIAKTKATPLDLPKPAKKMAEPKIAVSFRHKTPLPIAAKWNLIPLLKHETANPVLEKATAALFKELYGHTSFWVEGLEYELVLALQENQMQKNLPGQLIDLFPSSPFLQRAFYQMLKGSNSYHVTAKKGYPPLNDFFCLAPNNPKTIYFSQTSFQALQALFGNDLTLEILSLEKEAVEKSENSYLTSQKLSALLLAKHHPLQMQDLEPLLDFSNPKITLDQILYQDDQGVCLRMDLPK